MMENLQVKKKWNLIQKKKYINILLLKPLSEKEFNLKVFDEILRFEKPITTRNK